MSDSKYFSHLLRKIWMPSERRYYLGLRGTIISWLEWNSGPLAGFQL